ncbi:MAG: YdbH domain-containing protein [Pseudomonas sp.]
MRKVVGLVVVGLMLVLFAVFSVQWVQRSLVAAGLEQLTWQQWRWHDGDVHLKQLSGVYVTEQGRLGIAAQGMRLRPVWRGGPSIEHLLIDDLQLIWQPAETLPRVDAEHAPWILPSLAEMSGLLGWLPQVFKVHQLRLQLPCDDAFCQLQGSLQVDSQQQPLALTAQLGLLAQDQVVNGRLQIQEQAERYLVQADVQVPEALPLAGLGLLRGNLQMKLENQGDQWLLHQGQLAGRLEQPQLEALASVPSQWQPEVLTLQITPQPGSLAEWRDSLLLAVQLEMEGAIGAQLSGNLAVSSRAQWQAELSEARLHLSAAQLALSSMQIKNMQLDWPLSGMVDAQQLRLQLGDQAPVTIERLTLAEDMILTDVLGQLRSTQLTLPLATPDQLLLTGPVRIGVQRLQQSALQPQGWNLSGDLRYSAAGLRFEGDLAALSGLNSHLRWDWPTDQPWQLQLSLADIFLRAANPLAATFADWPSLLSFSSGRLTGQLQASGLDSLDKLTGHLSLVGGEGIYDRATFSGLSLPLDIAIQGDQLRLGTQALSLNSLDPGLPLGPSSARGSYRAGLDQLAEGTLDLGGASLGVLDGQIQLEPATIDLGETQQRLIARVEGVELARLFEVYPAEGLSGRGTLDGRFPVSLVNGKLLIEEGQLQARQPGGILRYQAQQLQDMAASNPNLEQLAVVLDDFRYRVLASDVSYDEQGVLMLGLRLEGSNPAFQQGRQVNLNIQLEEDIPALLTSLQLSGQVSDIIRKRIEQRYLQQSSP